MSNERSSYKDRISGLEVTQHTNYRGHSHHFYFTNNGWYDGGKKLAFASDRCNHSNLYSLDIDSGAIEQLTDLEPVPLPRELEFTRSSLNPINDEIYFFHDLNLMALDPHSKKLRVLHEMDPKWCVSMTNVSADGNYVYFGTWEDQSDKFEVDLLRGYIGFRETHDAKPLSQILRVAVDGSGADVVFEEHYWIGHVNTSPTQSHLLTYCHEGPWHLVDNRIWGLDVSTGKTWKIRETAPGEIVGHEYWLADGIHIGYHGHIEGGASGMLGQCRYDNTNHVENSFPGKTGHIYSRDEKLIVGDGGGVIRLWKWDGERYLPPRILCRHDSAMHIQQTHPHPRISPDGSYVAFSSDRSGYGNVYTVPLVDFESLPLVEE
ncbi:MAG: PD40 domain-containing protein [Trueperaceae bacterium]|nr:PD40 domain-containing protein [Trueperaceae bacterium]